MSPLYLCRGRLTLYQTYRVDHIYVRYICLKSAESDSLFLKNRLIRKQRNINALRCWPLWGDWWIYLIFKKPVMRKVFPNCAVIMGIYQIDETKRNQIALLYCGVGGIYQPCLSRWQSLNSKVLKFGIMVLSDNYRVLQLAILTFQLPVS